MDRSLYHACSKGKKDVAYKLLSSKGVCEYVDPIHSDTPLHQACKQGWMDVVELLIQQYGCDPFVTTRNHQSLLHYACGCGHIDIVEYLINEQHLDPLIRDHADQLEPLDYALNYEKTDIAMYICQHCISSDKILESNRIKTTLNLIKGILRTNPLDPKWKTADGYNILQLVGSSKSCISHMPSAIVLEMLNTSVANDIAFQPHWRTSDGDNLLQIMCQSKTYLS